MLTVDDLHWAEPTLLDLLARVPDEVADLPLLLLCDARPELLESDPTGVAGPLNSSPSVSSRSTTGEIERAVAALLDNDVPDAVVRAVTDWSGGNPLFVEEIVSAPGRGGCLARADARGR